MRGAHGRPAPFIRPRQTTRLLIGARLLSASRNSAVVGGGGAAALIARDPSDNRLCFLTLIIHRASLILVERCPVDCRWAEWRQQIRPSATARATPAHRPRADRGRWSIRALSPKRVRSDSPQAPGWQRVG